MKISHPIFGAVTGIVFTTVLGVSGVFDRRSSAPATFAEPVKAQRVDSWRVSRGAEVTRQPVPGGWLYVTTVYIPADNGHWGTAGVASTFVPDASVGLSVEKTR